MDANTFKTLLAHLGGQFERGLPILLTGAGFSLDATNILGKPVPSYVQLRDLLWEVCFPGKTIEANSLLQDLYAHAQIRHSKELVKLLTSELSVDPESLPDFYRILFSAPWYRAYTLNIDDLEVAVSRRFTLPRPPVPVSATSSLGGSGQDISRNLEFVHLNGTLADLPDRVTFSNTQYAERLARAEPWYVALAADLLSHSFVMIGTRLDEPPLWQHLELRRMRGGRQMYELRPKSYLVTPRLDLAKQALLQEFNILWVPMTAREFTEQVLSELQSPSAAGLALFSKQVALGRSREVRIPEVAELARNPIQSNEYLLGQEPLWADLQSGRAIARDSDADISRVVKKSLGQETKGLVVITGTAASGKSTALMRVCLRLVADGVRVGWIDRDSDLSPREIRGTMKAEDAPPVLAIDDADLYGVELGNLVREMALSDNRPLVLVATRAGKIDRVLNSTILTGVPQVEISVPHLTDRDIVSLLDVLERENRLGILRGKSRAEQIELFRNQAGRQLLVAMIQATSGAPFKEKAVEELNELPADARHVYALVAVASAFRFSLRKDEVLVASGDRTNAALNIVDQLTRRHVLTVVPKDGSLRARHRVIAELLLDELQKTGELKDILGGLAFLAATKVNPAMGRGERPWRMLRVLLNHDFLARTINPEAARNLYGSLEQLLPWDFHYWLQRGSLEVEFGSVDLAENFLNQARGLAADDPYVQTEWSYLLFRRAIERPAAPNAPDLVKDATETLEDLIQRPGVYDPYPSHVLGAQGLAWARRALASRAEKDKYLTRLIRNVKLGCEKHPRAEELDEIFKALKREQLELAVVKSEGVAP